MGTGGAGSGGAGGGAGARTIRGGVAAGLVVPEGAASPSTDVKLRGREVIINGVTVGDKFFVRDGTSGDFQHSGAYIFTVGGRRLRMDTSVFGYSRDADQWFRQQIKEVGLHGLIQSQSGNTYWTGPRSNRRRENVMRDIT